MSATEENKNEDQTIQVPESWKETLVEYYGHLKPVTEVGQAVQRKDGSQLRSGAEAYRYAIVVQVEPLVLVSRGTDMRWSATVKIDDFAAFGKVKDDVLQACMRRL
jgi:hypothetical protein